MADPCSYSNLSDIIVTHYEWQLSPDFTSSTISSTIDITAKILTENTAKLVRIYSQSGLKGKWVVPLSLRYSLGT